MWHRKQATSALHQRFLAANGKKAVARIPSIANFLTGDDQM
jgi:hypothetical protein